MAIRLIQGKQISVNLTGSFSGSFTGNLIGSASFATSSSFATNAASASQATSASYSVSSSVAISSSFSTSGSYSLTSSFASIATSASFAVSSSTAVSSSFAVSSSQAQNSISSSYPLRAVGSSLVSTYVPGGGQNASTTGSIFIGSGAGGSATNAFSSNFLGQSAGNGAANASNSNFFGTAAGQGATNANSSNFFGPRAGESAGSADYSNFLGANSGYLATNANGSNFFGLNSGYNATNAARSNFFGLNAGYAATNASYSTLVGFYAGTAFLQNQNETVASIGPNNIIIGTNITLESGRRDSINLGAIIFATGSYSDTDSNVFSGSLGTGKVGVNNPNPNYTLDVSGSVNFTGDLYQNGVLFESGDKYMWYSIQIIESVFKYNSSALVNPQQQGVDLSSILPYTYVDIIDQANSITYTSLTFVNINDINTFITDNGIQYGKVIVYSNKNNTGNLRVGGVNLFSTQIAIRGKDGKVSSKRAYSVNSNNNTYNALTASLVDTLVSSCSSIVPNFSTNYVNQTQVEAIVANPYPNDSPSYYSFAPISKYKKRQFSRYYVGRKTKGIDVSGNEVVVSNPNQAKILGVAVYEYINFGFEFRSFITNYGYSTQTKEKIGPTNTGGSMLNVYIVQTSDDCRALVVEPIGVDRILSPPSFEKISDVYSTPILPDLTIYRKGNATQIATYDSRIDAQLGISTYLSPTLFSNFRTKTINEVDIINLYSDRTCDLFEKAVKLDKLKYTNKKYIDLTLLNSNYQKN